MPITPTVTLTCTHTLSFIFFHSYTHTHTHGSIDMCVAYCGQVWPNLSESMFSLGTHYEHVPCISPLICWWCGTLDSFPLRLKGNVFVMMDWTCVFVCVFVCAYERSLSLCLSKKTNQTNKKTRNNISLCSLSGLESGPVLWTNPRILYDSTLFTKFRQDYNNIIDGCYCCRMLSHRGHFKYLELLKFYFVVDVKLLCDNAHCYKCYRNKTDLNWIS